MHPCQLLLLALHIHPTRKFDVLLGHEIQALNDLLRGQPNGRSGSTAAKNSLRNPYFGIDL
jgi:hypothetical protein